MLTTTPRFSFLFLAGLLSLFAGLPAVVRADEPAAAGVFISVPNPITSETANQIVEATDLAVRNFNRPANERRDFKIIYDFNPNNQRSNTKNFGPCHDLAKYLLNLQNVTTVAFVHNEVTGHAVLPVLACQQVVLGPDAKIGSVLGDPKAPLNVIEVKAYEEVAKGRYCPAVVVKMLDKDMQLLKATRVPDGGEWYIDARKREEEDKNGIKVFDNSPVVPAGPQSTLYTAVQAREFGLCQKEFKKDRQEVARAYGLPPSSLTDLPLLSRAPVGRRIEIHGEVTEGLREKVNRRLKRAIDDGANHIIVQLECSGGDPAEAERLAEDLRNLKDAANDQPVRTIAYIPNHAWDTAAIIALGCTDIVLNKNADFGDFSSIVYEQRNGWVVVTEASNPKKYATVQKTKEVLARLLKNHYSGPVLARGLMEPDLVLYAVESRLGQQDRQIVTKEMLDADRASAEPKWRSAEEVKKRGGPEGTLLVLSADEAHDLGLAQHVVADWDQLCAVYGLDARRVNTIRADWLGDVADFLTQPWMAILLVMIGITCLILEFKIPGATLPGIIAAICFVLFFWSHSQLKGSMVWLAALFFILGLVLIALEIFVMPGFGAPGICGILLVVGSLVLVILNTQQQTHQGNWSVEATLGIFGLALVGSVIGALILASYLPNIPYVNRLILKPQGEETEGLSEDISDMVPPHVAALLGAIGVAATPLRPAGKVQFGDEFVDVVAEGGYIVPGTRVQVIEIEGNRIVVKEV